MHYLDCGVNSADQRYTGDYQYTHCGRKPGSPTTDVIWTNTTTEGRSHDIQKQLWRVDIYATYIGLQS